MNIKGDVSIKDLLPLGSVVTLKDSNGYRIMITAYFPKKSAFEMLVDNQDETCDIYDYMGIDWYGVPTEKKQHILFNHDKIDTVLFRGYVNEESNAIKALLAKHFYEEE